MTSNDFLILRSMKILLVDDQQNQLDYLEIQLQRTLLKEVHIVKVQNPIEGLKILKNNSFDLLFLDIEMPEMTGFELIDIFGLENLPPVIFTTAHSKYAVNAFRVNAIDFLLKPIDPEELNQALSKIEESSVKSQKELLNELIDNLPVSDDKRLVLAQGQTYLFISYDDIICIQGSGSYSDFFLTDGRKLTASKRLNHFWKRIEGKGFMRTHQSHIVNEQHIIGYKKADGGEILLKNNLQAPVNTQIKEKLKHRFGI
jgi:two-component system LytT family response regulator